MAAAHDYTLVTCHFGDPFWIRHCLAQVDRHSDGRVAEVVVVDQDRGSAANLEALPRVREVLAFPVDDQQVAILGHDHPAALNRALAHIEVRTSHVLILDSDCFPVNPSWLDRLADVTVAADPAKWGLSHPCLMAFPAATRGSVDFAEGLAEVGLDTGRLVALQLARSGHDPHFTRPEGAFLGKRGTFYLERSVYHHGSASFASSTDIRLASTVDPVAESVYRRQVERNCYRLSRAQRARLQARQVARQVSSVVARASSARAS